MAAHVYYTINCGLYFSDGETGIFIDGIHGGTDVGYSPVHPKTVSDCARRIGIFHDLKALLFTHCHSDHYDPAEAEKVLSARPPLFLYTPETPLLCDVPGVRVTSIASGGLPAAPTASVPSGDVPAACATFPDSNGTLRFRIGNIEVFAVRTTHDGGRPLCFTPHVSFVINIADESYFAAGDAGFAERSAGQIQALCRGPIRAAFVNSYQLLTGPNREFLSALGAKRHVLIHLPQPRDDKYNARLLYNNAIKKYPWQRDCLLLPGFYSQVF